jgi:hypothetical protein
MNKTGEEEIVHGKLREQVFSTFYRSCFGMKTVYNYRLWDVKCPLFFDSTKSASALEDPMSRFLNN